MLSGGSYHEQGPGQFQFSKSTTCFTGIGIGLLGAAAVSSSPTLADLPKLGSEAVRIAWRMGVLVNDISQGIECQEVGTEPESWAAVVMSLDEDTVRKELDDFNTSTVSITDARTRPVDVLTRNPSAAQYQVNCSSVPAGLIMSQSVDLRQSAVRSSESRILSGLRGMLGCLSMEASATRHISTTPRMPTRL